MTLLLVEGFADSLPDYRQRYPFAWNGNISTNPVERRISNGRSMYSSNDGAGWRIPAAQEHATVIMGCAHFYKTPGGGNYALLAFRSDNHAWRHIVIVVTTTGQIQVERLDSNTPTVLGVTSIAPLNPLTFVHIEAKVVLSSTTSGSVVVRLNEAVVLNITGVRTMNSSGTKTVFDSVTICSGGQAGLSVVTDWYVCNGAGSVNNDFLGDCVVETLLPTGNGNSSVLVGSDGNSTNNYALVNEANPDTTSYVGSGTSGDKDTYAFADLAHTSGTVKGVQTTSYAAKSDAGPRTGRAVTRSGGADYGGADLSLSTTYFPYDEIVENDPATSTAWTISGVNSAEFGFEARP